MRWLRCVCSWFLCLLWSIELMCVGVLLIVMFVLVVVFVVVSVVYYWLLFGGCFVSVVFVDGKDVLV